MSNKDIADSIKQTGDRLVIADSAEPKSNDELTGYGVSVLPSQKGQGSVNQGIQYVQDQTIYVTKRSINLWKEYENYAWKVNKDGDILNVPIDMYNHALDAIRYGMESLKPVEQTYQKNDFRPWSLE
jgi:phage terminase large subunit